MEHSEEVKALIKLLEEEGHDMGEYDALEVGFQGEAETHG